MTEANPVGIPMDPNIKLQENPDANKPNQSNSYARLLGSLQFLANSMQPDITYVVNKLASYTANPGLQHHGALKRILRYLKGTKTLGITYHESQIATDDDNLFHGYADAAFANADDRKSTTGYVFLAAGGAVTWKSKNKLLLLYPPQKQNMWHFWMLDTRPAGLEICMENLDSLKTHRLLLEVIMKDL